MRRLAALLLSLLLAACVQGPFVALPPDEARAVRLAPPAGTAVVMLVPPGGAEPGALPLIPGVLVTLDGTELAMLGASDALLLPVTAPARLGLRNPASLGGGTAETVLQPGRTTFLAVRGEFADGPRSLSPHPLPRLAELPEAEGRALLTGRVPVRPGGAAADPGQAALRGVQADAATASAVARGEVPPGRARLVVGTGSAVNARAGLLAFAPSIATARGDLVVEGVDIAYVEGSEAVALDLPPGRHVLHWRPRLGIGSQRMPASMAAILPCAVELEAGRTVALSADLVDMRGMRLSPAGGPAMFTATTTGGYVALLSPVPEGPAALLARPESRLLVPAPGRLAALPGAAAPGR